VPETLKSLKEPGIDEVRDSGGRGRYYLEHKGNNGLTFIRAKKQSALRLLERLGVNNYLAQAQKSRRALMNLTRFLKLTLQRVELDLKRLQLLLLCSHCFRDDLVTLTRSVQLALHLLGTLSKSRELCIRFLRSLLVHDLGFLITLKLVQKKRETTSQSTNLVLCDLLVLVLSKLALDLLSTSRRELLVVLLQNSNLIDQDLFVQLCFHTGLALCRALLDQSCVLLLDRKNFLLLLSQRLHCLCLSELG